MLTNANITLSRRRVHACLWLVLTYTLPYGIDAYAEGIIDITPHVGVGVIYDDNVFRFSSSQQAKQQFGSDATSDVVKRAELGLDAKLRLSRQLFTLSSNISKSTYNRFNHLDNTGTNHRLGWSYQIGNHIYGELSASQSKSLAGFNEIKGSQRNIRTSNRKASSINWNYHPDWTIYGAIQKNTLNNDQATFQSVDRSDDIYLAGIRYANPRGTQLALSYQLDDAEYPGRAGFTKLFFGDENQQRELTMSASWLVTPRIRLMTQLSRVELEYQDIPQRNFHGFAEQFGIGYQLTEKSSVQMQLYQNVSPIDDVVSTYVKSRGVNISPTWHISEKLSAHANVGYETRDYLGSAGFFNSSQNNRNDKSTVAGLNLRYLPTQHTVITLDYNAEDRTSNTQNFDYRYNQLSLNMQYDF